MVVSGIIRPPPDIRAVADRTAKFVAKNGRAFEARILNEKRAKTPKFSFLQPTSPFRPYYEDRIKFYEQGGNDEDEADRAKKKDDDAEARKDGGTDEAARQQEQKVAKKHKAGVIDPLAKLMLRQRETVRRMRRNKQSDRENGSRDRKTAADSHTNTSASAHPTPSRLGFETVSIMPPSSLSVVQIETIQLVAQFTAMDGKAGTFLKQLSIREWNNSTFAFCRPRHPHFPYFSALVDVYRSILDGYAKAATTEPSTVQSLLEQAAYTAEYERDRKAQDERDDNGMAAIDWQDFVVVETIDFAIDEVVLPPPPPPDEAQQQAKTETDNQEMEESESSDDDDDDDDEENNAEKIRVVPSYTPKVVGPANVQAARAIDPVTGKSVAVADVPEHMRIQFLDPKWAEERKKFQDKQKESNLVSDDVIAANISKFTAGRSDQPSATDTSSAKDRATEPSLPSTGAATMASPIRMPPPPPPATSVGAVRSVPSGSSAVPAPKRQRVDGGSHSNGGRTTQSRPPLRGPTLPAPGMNTGDATAAPRPVGPKTIVPAEEFAAFLGLESVTLRIRIPNDPTQLAWNFYGQVASLTVPVMSTVMSVKQRLSSEHLNGIPPNKIQLRDFSSGFLSNKDTLAELNIGPSATLELVPKTRGGRR